MKTCENCIHYDLCSKYFYVGELCGGFKDKSKFIELPCPIGDTVYEIKTFVDEDLCDGCQYYYEGGFGDYPGCNKGTHGLRAVECMTIEKCECTMNDMLHWLQFNCFNETIFLTQEEANKKLEELKHEKERA